MVPSQTANVFSKLLESVSKLQISVVNCINAETQLMHCISKRIVAGNTEQAPVLENTILLIKTNLQLQMLLQLKLEHILDNVRNFLLSYSSLVLINSDIENDENHVSDDCSSRGSKLNISSTCWGE